MRTGTGRLRLSLTIDLIATFPVLFRRAESTASTHL
jgi:hypothetical protein